MQIACLPERGYVPFRLIAATVRGISVECNITLEELEQELEASLAECREYQDKATLRR